MNLGCHWICLVGITHSNNPGTEREILPCIIGDSLVLPYMVIGIQFQGMGILFNYNGQRSELV